MTKKYFSLRLRYTDMSIFLQYIRHDCFLMRTPVCTCVFDFWTDPDGHCAFLDSVDVSKPFYVIVSHHHKDHFTRKIFRWAERFPNIHYIISKDTARSVSYLLKQESAYRGEYRVSPSLVTVMKPGDIYEDPNIRITAFGSTDIGNSYMVQACGQRFFHAGDLNAWIWKDESTNAEVSAALRAYDKILDDIRTATDRFDLVMFPVDARIGRDYWEGAARFVRRFKVANFVPMHFCLGTDLEENLRFVDAAIRFPLYANPEYGHYCALTEPYSTLKVDC